MVALFHACAKALRLSDREPHLDLSSAERARLLEARIPEDVEHRCVLGEHIGDELLDSGLGGLRRELFEQPGRCASPLEVIRDREGDLSHRRVAQARVFREGDDPFASGCICEHADECAAVRPIVTEVMLDNRRVHCSHAVEAQIAAVLREPTEERHEGARIAAHGRPQPQRRAVAEDYVHRNRRRNARGRRQDPPREPFSA